MTERAGRLLAIDLGQARIGLALSDPLAISARPLAPLERVGPRKDLERLAELIAEHGVSTAIVGLPLHLSGREGTASVAARDFARRLGRRLTELEVQLWDERLTTVEAERTLISANVSRRKRKQVVDSLAAVLILRSYLDASAGSGPAR